MDALAYGGAALGVTLEAMQLRSLITHRLANTKQVNRVYVMENGTVKEHGTHTRLMAANGLFTHLWNTQHSLEHFAEEVGA